MSSSLGYRVRPCFKNKTKMQEGGRKEGRKEGRQTWGMAKSLKCLLTVQREDLLSDPQRLCFKKPSLADEISLLVKQGQSDLPAQPIQPNQWTLG